MSTMQFRLCASVCPWVIKTIFPCPADPLFLKQNNLDVLAEGNANMKEEKP